ncbi:hypothetical protein BFW38_07715 [Terasakiispira papahanaumokuakeensis]|uniref:DUF7822 domain-containing protein n=1 Tax=Terasakiispira papahanaumokuakeensis TaxID=197479 RepID=A0A1E2V9C1_9GAMM|nr:hypothetical protein [Terasakiispira papahanaumokuakeensis]ODC03452.1 hypothetical protein BFW38_07715 [Terasakiispira papahanaumokuakeensis]
MANRSYLYAAHRMPMPNAERSSMIGLCEWQEQVPFTFKLMMSGNPVICTSSIWPEAGKVAIAADVTLGMQALKSFLMQLTGPTAQPLVREAIDFLGISIKSKPYFILEAAELFDREGDSLDVQTQCLLESLQKAPDQVPEVLAAVHAALGQRPGFWARLFKKTPPPPQQSPLEVIRGLGLGRWSNILSHDLRGVVSTVEPRRPWYNTHLA